MYVRVTNSRYSSCGLLTPCSFRLWFMMAQSGHTQPLSQSLNKCEALVHSLKSLLLWITVMGTVLDAVVACDLCHEKTHSAVAQVYSEAMLRVLFIFSSDCWQEWSCIIPPTPVTALFCISCSFSDQKCLWAWQTSHISHMPLYGIRELLMAVLGCRTKMCSSLNSLWLFGLSCCSDNLFFSNFWHVDLSFFVVSIVGLRIHWNNFFMWLWKPLTPADLLIFPCEQVPVYQAIPEEISIS